MIKQELVLDARASVESADAVLDRARVLVLGTPIDALDWSGVLSRIRDWAARRESRVVCICNVHSVVTARANAWFDAVLHDADLATPDGAPIAWMMRQLTGREQRRISGADLMWRYCADAASRSESIFLYGNTPQALEILETRLLEAFPGLRIAGRHAPPFRPLTVEEDESVVRMIADSGAGTVWVSLGCPKQERWMAEHRGRIPAVMIGVGAAFDFLAGTVRRAPRWMQDAGLEWLHRLASEPRRLWRRYLETNTVFVACALAQLVRRRG